MDYFIKFCMLDQELNPNRKIPAIEPDPKNKN